MIPLSQTRTPSLPDTLPNQSSLKHLHKPQHTLRKNTKSFKTYMQKPPAACAASLQHDASQ